MKVNVNSETKQLKDSECSRCSKSKNVELHHVTYKSKEDKAIIVSLCKKCHSYITFINTLSVKFLALNSTWKVLTSEQRKLIFYGYFMVNFFTHFGQKEKEDLKKFLGDFCK
ncbi:MAG: hypothetical protein PHV11_07430 [Candidatus Bipolaricaulis sp.]|nr:hypothetical protein [Candidatus Bipolaricaulis sp.]